MMGGMGIYIIIAAIGSVAIYAFAYFKGKSDERMNQLKQVAKDVKGVIRRKNERDSGTIDSVRNRMRQHLRK